MPWTLYSVLGRSVCKMQYSCADMLCNGPSRSGPRLRSGGALQCILHAMDRQHDAAADLRATCNLGSLYTEATCAGQQQQQHHTRCKLAYPGRVWGGAPVERDVTLAFHVPVLAAGVQAPLWRNPLLRSSPVVEPVALQPASGTVSLRRCVQSSAAGAWLQQLLGRS